MQLRHLVVKKMGKKTLRLVAALFALTVFGSRSSAATIYAIDDSNNLFTFDNLTPQNITTGVFVTGLASNEHLINLDWGVNPSNTSQNVLYGIGSSYRLYTINPATGAATPAASSFGLVSGNSFGMDYNPVVNRIRLISDNDNNIVIDPATGALATTQTNVHYTIANPPNPSVVGLAYTFNDPVVGMTTLYGIDSNTNTLVRVGSTGGTPDNPSTGNLTTIGALGVDTNNFVGFDISQNNVAFAAMQPTSSSVSNLYAINLATGAASSVGQIVGGVRVVDITLEPGVDFIVPEPASLAAISGLTMLAGLRRRRA
jgi:hypothetical protein